MAKSLVIVESPAKAKTISKFLGKDYQVEASIGHIRDLPGSAKEVPAKYKGEKWASLGVNVEDDFKPLYIIPEGKKKQVKKLQDMLKSADHVYLATDEDREGESISWHLLEVLKPKVKVSRLVFHEITKEAIENSLKNPRQVDQDLVHAQETRRILDRLYGYEVSPILWRKIAPKLSAGRVQSVAVRLVVERERTRQRFVAAEYYDLIAVFETDKKESFSAELRSIDDKKVALGKDFDYETGQLKSKNVVLLGKKEAEELREALQSGKFSVLKLEKKPYRKNPEAPFTTSTLQQEAARKLKYTAKRTMQIAQKLYENGYITYMRTDSTTLSETAVKEARNLIKKLYGEEYLSPEVRQFASKVKNAQEAHEAIRPSGTTFRLPEKLKDSLESDEMDLYDLIWKRTVACQMKEAELMSTQVHVSDGKHVFQASGKQIVFPGFLKAYVEGSDDPDEDLADQEKILPPLVEGQSLKPIKMEPKMHQTKAVARYTEASLIKELESRGIGRPSTYASIMDTIIRRDYVFKLNGALVPTFMAFAVVKLLEDYFSHLVDYQFTAEMEEELDEISNGKKEYLPYLREFYSGTKGHPGLTQLIQQEIDARKACTIVLGKDSADHEVRLRIGKFGPFLETDDERKASIPNEMPPDELTLDRALQLLTEQKSGGETLGNDPHGVPVYKMVGRYGPYVQLGEKGKDAKLKSIPSFLNPNELTLETALKLLEMPKSLGITKNDGEVFVDIGRYGPYLKMEGKNRTIPEGFDVLNLTLAQAEEILLLPVQSRFGGKGGAARTPQAALKDFGDGIKLLNGRYGMYVTDGKVNASLPKGEEAESFTLAQAKELLDKKKNK